MQQPQEALEVLIGPLVDIRRLLRVEQLIAQRTLLAVEIDHEAGGYSPLRVVPANYFN